MAEGPYSPAAEPRGADPLAGIARSPGAGGQVRQLGAPYCEAPTCAQDNVQGAPACTELLAGRRGLGLDDEHGHGCQADCRGAQTGPGDLTDSCFTLT